MKLVKYFNVFLAYLAAFSFVYPECFGSRMKMDGDEQPNQDCSFT